MATHVILGKGQIGQTVADILVAQGHNVRVLSRSGGVDRDGLQHRKVDIFRGEALIEATKGASVIYNCVNPGGYHLWVEQWPPLAASILSAAEAHGSDLVITGNLYGYGRVDATMTENTPLDTRGPKARVRVQMWRDALASHAAGRIRVTEARASDFFGPGATGNAMLGERIFPRVMAGKSVSLLGDPDVAHSWTYIPDMAKALVRLGGDERSWGRAWHVPTAAPLSQREMINMIAGQIDIDAPKVRRLPWWLVIKVIGTFQPHLRGFTEIRHQWDGRFVMDSSDFTATFGDEPTDTAAAIDQTLVWWRQRMAN